MENYFLFLFMTVFKMIANKFQLRFEPKSRFGPNISVLINLSNKKNRIDEVILHDNKRKRAFVKCSDE